MTAATDEGAAVTGEGAAVTGDEAMGELWQAHGAALRRFALKLTLGDRQRAEDIVQETLLRAWRHPEVVGSGRSAIRSWLFTVTRHVAIDMWRARCRTDETVDDRQTELPDPTRHIAIDMWRARRSSEAAEEVIDDRHIDLPSPVEVIEQVVDALDVRAALAQLSPEHRGVITEMYFRGHSVTETAEILGIPAGTVKSRSYYALRILRRTVVPRPALGRLKQSAGMLD
jgi:RNA polymerase sigma-70 factor, ECF subfamily